jgi:hypothetical protein
LETPQMTKPLLLAAALAFFLAPPLPSAADTEKTLRAPVWVYLEQVPGSAAEGKPPLEKLDETARFIMGGMVYGWKFSYTPSDRTRGVAEEFSLEPVLKIPSGDPRLDLSEIRAAYPRLACQAEYRLDASLARWTARWSSVLFRSSKGRGTGERTAEAAGILAAYTNAVRQAVREDARKLEKNKPKEIRGEVLLREDPRLFADQGLFVAEVRVLIDLKEIIPYSAF